MLIKPKRDLDYFKKMILTSISNVDVSVAQKLALNLVNIENGNRDVYTSPFGERASDILSGWDKIFSNHSSSLNSNLLELEESNRAKFGPRSVAVPWKQRKQSLLDYYSKSKTKSKGVNLVGNTSGKLRPISASTAVSYLKSDTNSGLPYYTRKGLIKDRLIGDIESSKALNFPCVLFTRTQEAGKTRNVWGFPAADTLIEMKYYRPLLEFQRARVWRSALVGPDSINLNITKLIDSGLVNKKTFVSVDFSSYDASISEPLIDSSFNYIKSLFQEAYHPELDSIRDRFKTIPILTPDGVIDGIHGVPSGSTFTNEVDSIVQFLISQTLGFVDVNQVQIQGDDGVYSLKSEYEVKELFKAFENYGLNINRDKSKVSKDHLVYLQMLFDPYYRSGNGIIGGIYPTYRAINRICYQERWSDFEDYQILGKDYYSLRTISILENCKYHPLFKDLVRFIYQNDKYNLKFSEDGLSKFVSMSLGNKGASEILNHHYGDDVSGIKSFETYKIISSM